MIAFITHSADIGRMLDHTGVQAEPPRISPAREPPLCMDPGEAQVGVGAQVEAGCNLAWQPAPDDEVDQRINW